MTTKTYGEVLFWASSFLNEKKKEREAAEYLLGRRLGWNKTEVLMHLRKPMPMEQEAQFIEDIKAFEAGYPAQYIIGSEEFYGREFNVTPATLIPRPETEELIELCLKNNQEKEFITVVDVGTGTGIIAITLKKLKPTWRVIAIDISEEALEVARQNAQKHQVSIEFMQGDLLGSLVEADETVDIVISNPPYISEDEWEDMDESVREYEPKQALFADNNGLLCYEQMIPQIKDVLAIEGRVYFEFGFKQGRAIQQLYQEAFTTKKVMIYQDLNGQDRMLEMK
ncbi:peptide chain release factor N(5)-glutamine methyltransferase [Vagococcus xieshaowenii]|uniref:Release factor glutamine methyltransferase n=1 Tax=Vagococcus xieshaowenii TaxID=2562451 RepID=A0AAJ5EGF3_9ENTE|nr:peptide chain release factor N(5)-glutamine methyltransferase [Vagococcus xieshaowenii]QCA28442.1 peptide chain release factor N(5)-glutamine methyltransferase [Vagococcus xieshaowenii]TFZ42802.1 peptide chain release factor N(5)-glutamine methyltransferase [Vagococcus xieshaowenii]